MLDMLQEMKTKIKNEQFVSLNVIKIAHLVTGRYDVK